MADHEVNTAIDEFEKTTSEQILAVNTYLISQVEEFLRSLLLSVTSKFKNIENSIRHHVLLIKNDLAGMGFQPIIENVDSVTQSSRNSIKKPRQTNAANLNDLELQGRQFSHAPQMAQKKLFQSDTSHEGNDFSVELENKLDFVPEVKLEGYPVTWDAEDKIQEIMTIEENALISCQTDTISFECDRCTYVSGKHGNLTRHIKLVHKRTEVKSKWFSVEKSVYPEKSTMVDDIKYSLQCTDDGAQLANTFACTKCSYIPHVKANLDRHIKMAHKHNSKIVQRYCVGRNRHFFNEC